MNRKKLKVNLKSPKHYLEFKAFELRNVLLWWAKKNYIALPIFRWLETGSVSNRNIIVRICNNHYFNSAEIFDLTGWKEDKKLMMVDYLVYFDILQCYLYIDRQRIEADKRDTKKRKVHLKKLVDKYSL